MTGVLGRVEHPFQPHQHTQRNPYREVQGALSRQDRIALAITTAIGTMYAVYVFAVFMAAWMLLQVAMGNSAFDPYPFAFLLFVGNIVQLLLMPLIMVGQNLQSRHAEARAEEEYATIGKIFHDLETALAHLDAQDEELLRQSGLLLGLVRRVVPEPDRSTLEALPGGALTPSGAAPTAGSAPGSAGTSPTSGAPDDQSEEAR